MTRLIPPMTWQQAWDLKNQTKLEAWFRRHTGPSAPLINGASSGLLIIDSQAAADALVGKTHTGRLRLTAGGIRLHDFKLVNDLDSSVQDVAVLVTGGHTGSSIDHVEFDGQNHAGTVAAIAGDTWGQLNVTACEFYGWHDSVRGFVDSTYRHLYVHDPKGDPTYTGGNSGIHADAFQVIRSTSGQIRMTESWLDHGVLDPNVISCIFIKSDAAGENLDNVQVDHCYLNGGKSAIVLVEDGAGNVPTNIRVNDNRFGRDFIDGVWAGAGVNSGAGVERLRNVWADTLDPVVLTWGAL